MTERELIDMNLRYAGRVEVDGMGQADGLFGWVSEMDRYAC